MLIAADCRRIVSGLFGTVIVKKKSFHCNLISSNGKRIPHPLPLHVDGVSVSLVPDIYKCQILSHFIQTPLEKGNTYLFWKEQMENLFRIHRVSEIVHSNQVILPEKNNDGSSNLDHQIWLQKNWIVVGWIQSSVAPPMCSLVMGHSTAYDC